MMHRNKELDVVRGLAVLLAMGWHLNGQATGNIFFDALTWPGRTLGWAGVDLFFVLSGFLVGQLMLRECIRSAQFDWMRFFVRRAMKLWPTLYVFLAFMLLSKVPAESFLWQIGLHLQSYFHTSVATHLWSLAVEEHFYFLIGGLFFITCRFGWSPLKFTPVFYIVLIGAAFGLRWWMAKAPSPNFLDLQTYSHLRFDSLAVGVLLAWLSIQYEVLFMQLCKARIVLFFVAIVGYGYIVIYPKGTIECAVYGFVLSYLASAALMLLVYGGNASIIFPFVASPLAFMGVNSYSIYVWHVPFMRILKKIFGGYDLNVSNEVFVIISYVVAIFGSYLAARLIERPFLVWRDRYFPGCAIYSDVFSQKTV